MNTTSKQLYGLLNHAITIFYTSHNKRWKRLLVHLIDSQNEMQNVSLMRKRLVANNY